MAEPKIPPHRLVVPDQDFVRQWDIVKQNNNEDPHRHSDGALPDVGVIVSGFADAVKKVVAEHRANGRAVYSLDADKKLKSS